jgi:excisionase family DNA binding protein
MEWEYTTGQIALLCCVAPRTVRKWFDSGKLQGSLTPVGGHRKIHHDDLLEFLNQSWFGWREWMRDFFNRRLSDPRSSTWFRRQIEARWMHRWLTMLGCDLTLRPEPAPPAPEPAIEPAAPASHAGYYAAPNEERPPGPAQSPAWIFQKVYTTPQVASICRVAPRTVNKWFDSGRLRGYKIPGSNKRRIPREQLIRFLKEHGMPLGALEQFQDDQVEKPAQLPLPIAHQVIAGQLHTAQLVEPTLLPGMKRVFTTGQVARICHVSPATVQKWFDSGQLTGYRIPGSQDRRIPRERLIQFLREKVQFLRDNGLGQALTMLGEAQTRPTATQL